MTAPHAHAPDTPYAPDAAVIGGGPAGLMAAEQLASAGYRVAVFDAMPSVGRKFLLAGIGGLNLTHSEAFEHFVTRFGQRSAVLAPLLERFGAEAVRDWAAALGVETFVGSSGRVFPREMKAAPLLRAWLRRLRAQGVQFWPRHRWLGWQPNAPEGVLSFATPNGAISCQPRVCVLALGGASWARLGSDGAWLPDFAAQGIALAPLRPANCGFDIVRASTHDATRAEGWSEHFCERFAGQALKSIGLRYEDAQGTVHVPMGECLVTRTGLEGSLIYAHSARLRDAIEHEGSVTLYLDLAPGRDAEQLHSALARPRGSRSLSSHLQSKAGISGLKAGLLRECAAPEAFDDPARLAREIKALPVTLLRPRPLDEAISTAGGLCFEALDKHLMLRQRPGVFCCGEMLDWEAPTGGYLLTACLSTGYAAGVGAVRWLGREITPDASASPAVP